MHIGRDVVRIMEKYSRGRRGAPAKGVGRATGARVQIPLSPLATLPRVRKEISIVDISFFVEAFLVISHKEQWLVSLRHQNHGFFRCLE